MSDYRTLRREERKAAMYHLSLCMLAVIDDDVLDLMGLSPAMRSGINTIRAEEDDYAGCGAAFFTFNISNSDITEQDRVVVSQILGVGAGAVANRKVVTKNMLDSADVLTNVSIMQSIETWISEAPAPNILVGDSVFEQGQLLLAYIEQYNSAVLDKSHTWTKGEANDNEAPKEESSLWDYIPFVGE